MQCTEIGTNCTLEPPLLEYMIDSMSNVVLSVMALVTTKKSAVNKHHPVEYVVKLDISPMLVNTEMIDRPRIINVLTVKTILSSKYSKET